MESTDLFQTNNDFCFAVIGSGTDFQFRKSHWNRRCLGKEYFEIQRLERELQGLEVERIQRILESDLAREIQRSERLLNELNGMVLRMLGTINGRDNFERVNSIHCDDARGRLVCRFNANQMLLQETEWSSFNFGGLVTPNMPTSQEHAFIDNKKLQSMTMNECKNIVESMLRREEELRLHDSVQAMYGRIGEKERDLVRFTTALQAHVASEFNVQEVIGIELMRSASSLFPDIAQISHYVRHNRCFKGVLKPGNEAPDALVVTMDGLESTLWTEINKRQRLCSSSDHNPTLIIGASYT